MTGFACGPMENVERTSTESQFCLVYVEHLKLDQILNQKSSLTVLERIKILQRIKSRLLSIQATSATVILRLAVTSLTFLC